MWSTKYSIISAWEGPELSPEIHSFVVEEDGKRKLALSCDCEIPDNFEYEISWYVQNPFLRNKILVLY
jgi:hypothetical protein